MKKKTDAEGMTDILLAEDSPTQAGLLCHFLEKHGYRVATANNGARALERIGARRPALVISDIVMPGMGGYELCERIKADEKTRDIPVILLTSLTDAEDVLAGLECGADSYITKPYDEEYLLTLIPRLISDSELRAGDHKRIEIEILFPRQKRLVSADPHQTITRRLSSYEPALIRNRELLKKQDELQTLNAPARCGSSTRWMA